MNNEMSKDDILFQQLILSLQMQSMIFMGKIMNPATQKIEKNLDAARYSIDSLIAIRTKVKGNLGKEEDDMLNKIIYDLQLNYADEIKQEDREKQEKQEPDNRTTDAEQNETKTNNESQETQNETK